MEPMKEKSLKARNQELKDENFRLQTKNLELKIMNQQYHDALLFIMKDNLIMKDKLNKVL